MKEIGVASFLLVGALVRICYNNFLVDDAFTMKSLDLFVQLQIPSLSIHRLASPLARRLVGVSETALTWAACHAGFEQQISDLVMMLPSSAPTMASINSLVI